MINSGAALEKNMFDLQSLVTQYSYLGIRGSTQMHKILTGVLAARVQSEQAFGRIPSHVTSRGMISKVINMIGMGRIPVACCRQTGMGSRNFDITAAQTSASVQSGR